MHTIVYARAEKTALEPTGRYVTRDANLFPEFRATWEARAGIWMNKGTDEDMVKAKFALSDEGYTIFKFDLQERDPLNKAKGEVIKKAKAAEAKH